MHHAPPVVDVLLPQGKVESVCVAGGREVRRGSAFSQHLRNGVTRHEMNQEKD
jgi:hypothetical protein